MANQKNVVGLLTTNEAASLLSISPRKLWSITKSGDLPHVRIDRCVRYRFEDLQLWIDQHTKGGAK